MQHEPEALIVGAGPAGCATALHLASRGHSVVVLDRGRRADGKVCGEGLMPHGVAALGRLGIAAGDLGRPFVGIRYQTPSAWATGDFPDGARGFGIRRSRLDAALLDAARGHPGVEVREGVRVTAMSGGPGAMRVQTASGEVRSRVVIGADGLHSTVRRLAALGSPRGRAVRRYGARVHLQLDRAEPDRVEVWTAPGLELYLTPVGPRQVNVALLCDRTTVTQLKGDSAVGFRALLTRFDDARLGLRGAEALSEVAVCGPLRQRVCGVVADGVVLVGDAAGFVDAVTGEGMSLALLGSEIAAEVVSAGLWSANLDRQALAPYARRRHRMSRDLCRMTEVVVWGLRHPRIAACLIRGLHRRPEAFGALLRVQSGQGPLVGALPSLAGALAAGILPERLGVRPPRGLPMK